MIRFLRRANRVRVLIGIAVVATSLTGFGACGDDNAPTPAASTSTALVAPQVTLPPDPTASPSNSPQGQPAVAQPELKLRVINVQSGVEVTLPVGFGRNVAWSRDSRQIAVAEDGLSVGESDGTPFTRFWPSKCFDVEWSPTQDLVAAACADGLVVFDAGGKELARDDVSPLDWSRLSPWLHWSPDGHTIAYGTANGPIEILRNDGSSDTLPGRFVSAQWLSDGRLASIEQPDQRGAAKIRMHQPSAGFAVFSEVVSEPAPYGLAIAASGDFAAFATYGPAALAGTRVLPSTVAVIRLPQNQTVATFPAYVSNYGSGEFSPDGRSLLMQTDLCGPDWSLLVADPDGSTRTIATGGFMATKFSPNGANVAFTRGTELWMVPTDGRQPARRLAESVHGPAGFEWSPDSKSISFPPFFGGFDQCP